MIKQTLRSLVKHFIPTFYWKRIIRKYRNPKGDFEVKLLHLLCEKEKISLDIGAAGGLYIVHMAKYSSKVIAFEPIPSVAGNIQSMVNVLKEDVTINYVALSDKSGVAELRMLENDFGRSTIEKSNVLEETISGKLITIKVPVHTLDEYDLSNVGCIKIDVEGHELAVLKGASETIRKNMPSFIIETENRHKENAVQLTTDFIKGFGYDCFFICEGELHPFALFNDKTHQCPKNVGDLSNHYQMRGIYINNFVFVPTLKAAAFLESASKLSFN